MSCVSEKKTDVADLVLLNGKIWTVNPAQPWAQALAVRGNRILSVGTSDEIKKMVGDLTETIDLNGAFVLPGLIDSHTHFLDGALALSSVQLKDVQSREAFIGRIKEKAEELGKGGWVLDGSWDQQKFDSPEMPRKEWIDELTRENPVFINRYDGHMALANSLALKMAGITRETVSPSGGEILKDPQTGEPTGILKDAAMDLVANKIPDIGLQEKKNAIQRALQRAAGFGLTSIHEMAYPTQTGDYHNLEIYRQLLEENELTARFNVYIAIKDGNRIDELKFEIPSENDKLKIGGLKGFADGSLGSFTALFFEPYTDDPTKSGILAADMFPDGIMEERIKAADESGLQVAIHAIGDKAIHDIVDIMERVINEDGERDRRWRIEHAQHMASGDFERFAKLGIVASVQPYHAIDDGRWAEKKIGHERARSTYAFKSFLDNNVLLACGSDWTVAPLNPITGIYAAVTRRTLDGKNPDGWFPEQKISLEEAIKGYTINAAFAEFAENEKGSLESGKFADIVVLNQNLFEIPPEDIIDTEVKITLFDGKVIYKK
ncbi:MAG: amidohydrolase [Candidatus Aminicenantes bacterium]|nr:amidohydrolase [Candidatus Aminicenantes bacterium]